MTYRIAAFSVERVMLNVFNQIIDIVDLFSLQQMIANQKEEAPSLFFWFIFRMKKGGGAPFFDCLGRSRRARRDFDPDFLGFAANNLWQKGGRGA